MKTEFRAGYDRVRDLTRFLVAKFPQQIGKPRTANSLNGTRWISCRPRFFLPVRVLSRLFRRLFLQYLQEAFDSGKLRFFSSLATLQDVAVPPS